MNEGLRDHRECYAANNGFTLGIRAPGQTYKQCLAANSSTYSVNNWLPSSWQNGATKFALGNDVSGALFGDGRVARVCACESIA